MQTLSKDEALKFLPSHVKGQYNPAKYLLGGFVGTKREVLMHLFAEAQKANIEARAKVEADRLAKNLSPLNQAAKSGNKPKFFWQTPRDMTVAIPDLRQYGDAWLIFTNCKLNGGFYKNIPGVTAHPEMIKFEDALRSTQRRTLP
jgi:hypothetical protein